MKVSLAAELEQSDVTTDGGSKLLPSQNLLAGRQLARRFLLAVRWPELWLPGYLL